MAASRVKATASSGQRINVAFHVEGVDKTSDQFKEVRRDINRRMRDVMQRVGEREVLPTIVGAFPRRQGVMAGSLRVERERSGVFIGSRLRGDKNRALGWIDFGGQRPRDSQRRVGPKVIVRTLDSKRRLIDDRVMAGVIAEFRQEGLDAS